jgi:hypothetical protein
MPQEGVPHMLAADRSRAAEHHTQAAARLQAHTHQQCSGKQCNTVQATVSE